MFRFNIKKHVLQFKKPAKTSRNVFTTRTIFLVELINVLSGKSGIGEAAPLSLLSVDDVSDYESVLRTKLEQFCEVGSLEELDLTGNRLSSLPDEIQGLKKLKKLNLSRNRFHEFPGILVSMYWLQYLDLWDNEIEHVALGVEQMKGLVELELRGIQLPQQRIDSIRALLPKSKVFFSDPCDCIYNK